MSNYNKIHTTAQAKDFINKGMEGIDPITCRTDLLQKRINELLRDLRDKNGFIVHDDIHPCPELRFTNQSGGRPIYEANIAIDPRDNSKYFKFNYLHFN